LSCKTERENNEKKLFDLSMGLEEKKGEKMNKI